MIPQKELTTILSQPPYIPVEGATLRTPVKMRKRDLKRTQHSPFGKIDKENYGEGWLSRKVIQWKRENNVSAGRNVSLVVFGDQFIITATSGPPGGPHSELLALSLLPTHIPKELIRLVYTERNCCPLCHAKLKEWLSPETVIIYSAPYTPNSKRQRVNEVALQALQIREGIRAPSAKKILKYSN